MSKDLARWHVNYNLARWHVHDIVFYSTLDCYIIKHYVDAKLTRLIRLNKSIAILLRSCITNPHWYHPLKILFISFRSRVPISLSWCPNLNFDSPKPVKNRAVSIKTLEGTIRYLCWFSLKLHFRLTLL